MPKDKPKDKPGAKKQPTVQIVYKGLDELKPYANNPRRNDNAVDAVAASIKEFGFKVPIVIDKDGTIVTGHTRYKASKKLGLDKVPCIIASDLTPEQVKAFRLADNKTNELAEWDWAALQIEFGELSGFNFNMGDFGFSQMDLNGTPPATPPAEVTPTAYVDGQPVVPGQAVSGVENLPPELQGVPLDPAPLDKIEGNGQTQTERVIIVFRPEQKDTLNKLLGIEVTNIVYNLDEILGARGGE